jgi:hypothetical protein
MSVTYNIALTFTPFACSGDTLVGSRQPVYYIFDINLKPNATGPGRPGREDQASLTTMAAAGVLALFALASPICSALLLLGIGWDYTDLLLAMLDARW